MDRTKIVGLKKLIGYVGRSCLMMVVLFVWVLSHGCQSPGTVRKTEPEFQRLYRELQTSTKTEEEIKSEKLLTFSARDIRVGDLIQWLTDETGASIVVQEGLDDRRIAVEIRNQNLTEILDVTAARLGVVLDRRGRLYYLGQSRPDSRGVLVRRVRRLSAEELQQAVTTHVSNEGRMACFDDGLLVVCDKVQQLERISDMLDQVENAASPCWCIQLYILALGESEVFELGIEHTPSLNLAAAFANGASTIQASGGLQAALRLAADRSSSAVVGQPCFFLADGGKSEFRRTRRYPVQNSELGYEGRVSSQSVEYLDVGLVVNVELRERSSRSALLSLELELSDSDGEKYGVPIRVSEEYSTQAVIESGGVYLLGSLERSENRKSPWTMTWLGMSQDTSTQTLYVWGTARCVTGSLINDSVGSRRGSGAGPRRLPAIVGDLCFRDSFADCVR